MGRGAQYAARQVLNSERQHTDITLLSENKSTDKICIGGPDVNLILFWVTGMQFMAAMAERDSSFPKIGAIIPEK